MLGLSRKDRRRAGGKKWVSGLDVAPKIRYTEDGFAVTTLYLRNLPAQLTRDQLYAHFSRFGNMQNIRIHKKPSYSFGFVTFDRAESAAEALKIKFHSIGNRRIQVTIADSWHQQQQLDHNNESTNEESTSAKEELPIELTNITGTHLLDLNDDCLYEILSLKMFTVMDLCSVAETSVRLKEIATRVFIAKHKIFNCNSTIATSTIHEIRRLLINFGCFISELSIGPSNEHKSMSTRTMDLIVRYCSETLESLNLIDYQITEYLATKLVPLFNKLKRLYIKKGTILGAGKRLFANCASLIEFKVVDLTNCTNDLFLIFENTFPKLEHFSCKETEDLDDDIQLGTFISRHKNLKTLSINEFSGDCRHLFPAIADNLKQLEVLQIRCSYIDESTGEAGEYGAALNSLLSLNQLKKLKLNCDGLNITTLMNDLHTLKSLEFLELWHVDCRNILPALSQTKTLNVLRLMDCHKLDELDILGELDQLTELTIRRPNETGTFDLINIVKRLINLKTLHLENYGYKMDQKTYLKIVDVVRKRPTKQALEITCSTTDDNVADIQYDGDNGKFVKLHRFFNLNFSSDDGSIYTDYDFDDVDDDDDDDDSSWGYDQLVYPFDDAFYFNGYYGGFGYGSDDDDDDLDIDFFPF